MQPQDHEATAARIERTLGKCGPDDHELLIEGAMLAAAHRLNAHLHRLGLRGEDEDVMHTYLLTINEFRRLSVAAAEAMNALGTIEDLRPAYVRGNQPGGTEAGQRALQLLASIREHTQTSHTPTRSQP